MQHFHHDPYRSLADSVAAVPGIHSRVLCTTFCVSFSMPCLVCSQFVFPKWNTSGSQFTLVNLLDFSISTKNRWQKYDVNKICSCAHFLNLSQPISSLINTKKKKTMPSIDQSSLTCKEQKSTDFQ